MDKELKQARARLARRIQGNREERQRHEERSKAVEERIGVIADAQHRVPYPFWCEPCNADFEGVAYKEVRENRGWPLAWYVGFCPKGHKCLRYITDRYKDPYSWQSYLVKVQRAKYADDFMQPSDPRFREKYPEQWAKLQEESEQRATIQQYEQGILEGR